MRKFLSTVLFIFIGLPLTLSAMLLNLGEALGARTRDVQAFRRGR